MEEVAKQKTRLCTDFESKFQNTSRSVGSPRKLTARIKSVILKVLEKSPSFLFKVVDKFDFFAFGLDCFSDV